MQRENDVQTLNWADKTMSVLRLRQLEACETRLNGAPKAALFDRCDELTVEQVWEWSWAAQEQPGLHVLHEVEALRKEVLAQLPREAALLSVQERMLVERMLIFGGEAELLDVDEAAAAESLLRRMWCGLRREDDRFILTLPEKLMNELQGVLYSDEVMEDKLVRYDATVRGLLYIGGFLHSEEPLRRLLIDVVGCGDALAKRLGVRFLRASYDYFYDDRGEMILLHPGLAEPDKLMRRMQTFKDVTYEMDEETLVGAIGGAFPEEVPLLDRMLGLLRGAVRPEITEEEAVEDLRMLCKQDVSFQETREVLSSLLTVLPTRDMLAGLKLLWEQTPRWVMMRAAVVS